MSNLTDFFPSGGGGGLTPKFQEFTSSGTFVPSQELIDAGGFIEVFLVAAGGSSTNLYFGGSGGEVLTFNQRLTNRNGCSVVIGAGTTNGVGGDSSFNSSSSGGALLTAGGGNNGGSQSQKLGAGFGAYVSGGLSAAGSGTFGYGAGGAARYGGRQGVQRGKANSGQGSQEDQPSGSGYCLIKWYE